jgi:hypothetical protein
VLWPAFGSPGTRNRITSTELSSLPSDRHRLPRNAGSDFSAAASLKCHCVSKPMTRIDDFKHLLPRFIAVSLSSLKRSDLRPQPHAKTENIAAQMWPAAEILYHATDILRSASRALPWKATWSWSTFGCRTRLADTAATEWALWKTLPVSIARKHQAVGTEKT